VAFPVVTPQSPGHVRSPLEDEKAANDVALAVTLDTPASVEAAEAGSAATALIWAAPNHLDHTC
jgi:hypothetical protein